MTTIRQFSRQWISVVAVIDYVSLEGYTESDPWKKDRKWECIESLNVIQHSLAAFSFFIAVVGNLKCVWKTRSLLLLLFWHSVAVDIKWVLCVLHFLLGAVLPTDLQPKLNRSVKNWPESVSEVCVTPVLLERCCRSACSGIWQMDWNGFCLLSSVLSLPFHVQWNLNPRAPLWMEGNAGHLQCDFTERSR